MPVSPRIRRLHNDRKALEQLQADSSVFQFEARGEPADFYRLRFYGRSLARLASNQPVQFQGVHEVHLRLGANYPRVMPELSWQTAIFHPNISASGFVCLGGYGTHWVPSVALDELCTMLWDMIRYENYDVASPYNREASAWVLEQLERSGLRLPLDGRPIRDRVAAAADGEAANGSSRHSTSSSHAHGASPFGSRHAAGAGNGPHLDWHAPESPLAPLHEIVRQASPPVRPMAQPFPAAPAPTIPAPLNPSSAAAQAGRLLGRVPAALRNMAMSSSGANGSLGTPPLPGAPVRAPITVEDSGVTFLDDRALVAECVAADLTAGRLTGDAEIMFLS